MADRCMSATWRLFGWQFLGKPEIKASKLFPFWDSIVYMLFFILLSTCHVHRSMYLPYKLTPHLISLSGFEAGETVFSGTVLIGTGHMGSHRVKHSTFQNALKNLMSINSDSELCLTLLYVNTWYKPYSKLCQEAVTLKSIDKDVNIKKHWYNVLIVACISIGNTSHITFCNSQMFYNNKQVI